MNMHYADNTAVFYDYLIEKLSDLPSYVIGKAMITSEYKE